MKYNKNKTAYFLLALPLILYGCTRTVENKTNIFDTIIKGINADSVEYDTIQSNGAFHEEMQRIPDADINLLEVEIHLATGNLRINDIKGEISRAQFSYNVPALKPTVNFIEAAKVGKLIIKQPLVEDIQMITKKFNSWIIGICDSIPVNMQIKAGAGKNRLELGKLMIDSIEVDLGAGSTVINLTDNVTLRKLFLNIGIGKAEVNLNGNFENDVEVVINGGIGSFSLQLPDDIGVIMNIKKGIGNITINGFNKDNNKNYINNLYGKTDNTISVDITTGIGKIDISTK
ncbi:MAG: hypothetical protein HY738_11155 [Bacteroidia bacterium]|nr:hypothetical protein [Bacteroidia bacterium]